MAETNNFMNNCVAFNVDENENPSKQNCIKELELAHELKISSAPGHCEEIKGSIISQRSFDSIPNNNCLVEGIEFSNESCDDRNLQQVHLNSESFGIDTNPGLPLNDSNNGLHNTLQEESVDLLNISLNNSHDSFELNTCEINENVKDEVFHDAVQFFKDPSSFSFLEKAGSSSTSNNFTRSSLCKTFDPLHAKFSAQDSSRLNILQCIDEANIEPESFSEEPHLKNSIQPSDDILISFNSPLTCKMPDFQENHTVINDLSKSDLKENIRQTLDFKECELQEEFKDKQTLECEIPEEPKVDVTKVSKAEDSSCVNEVTITSEASDKSKIDVSEHCDLEPSMDNFLESVDQNEITKDTSEHTEVKHDISVFACESVGSNENKSELVEIKHDINISRQSVGNILMSFDSPLNSNVLKTQENANQVAFEPQKSYTEDELHQALKIQELHSQEILLKKQQEMELEIANIKQEMGDKISSLSKTCHSFRGIVEELTGIVSDYSAKQKDLLKYVDTLEQENSMLKGDVKTLTEDLQSVENTFSDFHKRYEQCKGMLKVYKENEDNFKLQNEKVHNELKEQKEMYSLLQLRSQEIAEKANLEVMNEKKSSNAQLTVLKAQLQKAELKISSLESDNKQLRIENSKLEGICDDLMARVSGT